MNRRTFLECAAGAAAVARDALAAGVPIVDTHIHLFDPLRPEGVPWPPKENKKLYKPATSRRFRQVVAGLGVVGAIEVEASPWLEDNQWVLDACAKDTILLGTIGNLEPGKPEFRKNFERFGKNPMFLGIRYGNLWGRSIHRAIESPEFLAGMKMIADAGLTMDSANPTTELIADLLRLTDKVPNLRIVIDHLPRLNPPEEAEARRAYEGDLRELAGRPRVYLKMSGVLRPADGRVPLDLAFYKPRLDALYELFGPDRVVYGSDWPNSDNWGTYTQGLKVVREYFEAKGTAAAEKYFWRNSIAAYGWKKRDSSQPG